MRVASRLIVCSAMIVPACHRAPASQPLAAPDADRIACAPAGAALAPVCSVELAPGGVVTVRNPDGGFHRLRIADGGRGVVTADGAAPAQVRVLDKSMIEVTIAGDRYRLPARVGAAR
ncbi:hypothetical protein [uncultured Sphingomonas sp.]|uniref:hypothetical protein n=1 Tax=uncultured Sphingomonas sp. TaxID=158754 RepID=UPI0035CB61FE